MMWRALFCCSHQDEGSVLRDTRLLCTLSFFFFLRCTRAQLPLKKAGWHLRDYAAAKENKISYPFKTKNTISVALFFFYSFIFTPPFLLHTFQRNREVRAESLSHSDRYCFLDRVRKRLFVPVLLPTSPTQVSFLSFCHCDDVRGGTSKSTTRGACRTHSAAKRVDSAPAPPRHRARDIVRARHGHLNDFQRIRQC